MNIRFASEGARLRVSLEEARELEREGKLLARIPFKDCPLQLLVELKDGQAPLAEFTFNGSRAHAVVCRAEFLRLLNEQASRNSRIESKIEGENDLTFVLEIDLFSRKLRSPP